MRSALSLLALLLLTLGAAGRAHAQDDGFAWSGAARVRYESLANQFRAGLNGSDQILSARISLRGEYRRGAWLFGGEFMDNRAWLADAGSPLSTSEVNALELVQIYAAYDFGAAQLTAGRFTLDIGSRRLIERPNYRNTMNAYTGARLDWDAPGGIDLIAFYTLPVQRLPADGPSLLDNEAAWDEETGDIRFWGLSATKRGLAAGASLEMYVYGLTEEDGDFATRDRDIVTPGVRVWRDPAAGAFDFDLEAALQRGEARASANAADIADLDVEAGFAHLEAGYTFAAPWSPRVAASYDYGSGDADPTDGAYERFDNLFGSRSNDFAPTGFYGALGFANISSPAVRVEFAPHARITAHATYRELRLDEAADAFASTGVRDPAGLSGDYAGRQIEARARITLIPNKLRLDVGGAVLMADGFLVDAPNATGEGDAAYGYLELQYTF